MKSHGLLDQVDNLIAQAKHVPMSLPGGDGDFIQSQLVRYGCLLTCAAIEQALLDIAVSYADRFGDGRLSAFVSESLKTGRNPSPGYIKELLSKFDPSWGIHIGTVIDSVGEDKIKSIISNRNRIAHGESVSMGVTSLLQWVPAARQLCLEIVKFAR
jgi:RiboL-PSP-HEPN